MELRDAIARVCARRDLDADEMADAVGRIMDGQGTPAQIAALLIGLRQKGESVDEVVGAARAMRARATPVSVPEGVIVDTCGTGGDGSGTFNISTTVAFIAAGAGAAVAKHGSRAVSSRSGSADVLEALGVKTGVSPKRAAECVDTAGVGFLFAPSHHPAFARLAPIRRQLGARTVFNLLGPLSNPAAARRQLLGVYSTSLVRPVAEALMALGSEEAMVVASKDGLDELSLSAPTMVARLSKGRISVSTITPKLVGLRPRPLRAVAGGDAARNARITRTVLSGAPGAPRDICLFNAAAALMVAGLAKDWRDGLSLAAASIDSGRAAASLAILVRLTNG